MVLLSKTAIQQGAGGSAITNILAKAQASAQAISDQQNSSPSPTTILKTVNSSGYYMCSQPKNVEMPSPTIIFHDPRTPKLSPSNRHQQNMMQHRNNMNNICLQPDNSNTFECDESDENSSQHHRQQQQFTQFHNNSFNYSQSEIATFTETQQEADQHTIELRMNNLGNEDTG